MGAANSFSSGSAQTAAFVGQQQSRRARLLLDEEQARSLTVLPLDEADTNALTRVERLSQWDGRARAPRYSGAVRCDARAARRRVAEANRMPEREQWQVMGNAAEIYQRALVPAIFGPWAPRVVELAGLRPGERVLDVACGTGVVARLAAEAVGADGRVAALDMNPGMLAVAAAVPAKGAAIEWIEGSAEALPFADAGFDAVCCQLGLQFPDREGALHEMARVAVPGGARGGDGLARDRSLTRFCGLGRGVGPDDRLRRRGGHAGAVRTRRRRRIVGAPRRSWSARLCDPRRNRERQLRLGDVIRRQPTRRLTACPDRRGRASSRPRGTPARGRARARTGYRAGLALLPDRGAPRALPGLIARTASSPRAAWDGSASTPPAPASMRLGTAAPEAPMSTPAAFASRLACK